MRHLDLGVHTAIVSFIMLDDCVAASTSLDGGFSERTSQFGKIPVLMREGDPWRWNNQIGRKPARVLHSTLQ
jgi:hypothetical protein